MKTKTSKLVSYTTKNYFLGARPMQDKQLNGWKISKDKQSKDIFRKNDHFVAKCPFDKEGSGLSIMARRSGKNIYVVELAIEVDNSVISCFRLDNCASEKEALEMVNTITEAI